MNYDPINTIITIASTSLLYFLLKNAIPAYFTEKGRNLATQEDIGKITKEVESVKEIFTQKSEQLRIDLQYFNQVRYSAKAEERSAIINCHEKYHAWFVLLVNVYFGELTEKTPDDIRAKATLIETAFHQLLLAEAQMKLYVASAPYISEFHELQILTHDLSCFVRENCLKYLQLLSRYQSKINALSPDDDSGIFSLALSRNEESLKFVTEFYKGKQQRYEPILIKEIEWRQSTFMKITALASHVNQELSE